MFIPRHPVVENQFCQFAETSTTGGIGGVLAYAGAVCYLVASATNQEAVVNIYSSLPTGEDEVVPFGFLMQKVKAGYHQVHPAGFAMPGDLGSSDVIAQPRYNSANGTVNGTKLAPVGVAHLGIWDTTHYWTEFTGDPSAGTAVATANSPITPGQNLYVCDNTAILTNGDSRVTPDDTQGTSFGTFAGVTTIVARAVKGVSAAQAIANINNTTLYPLRMKILI